MTAELKPNYCLKFKKLLSLFKRKEKERTYFEKKISEQINK
jgi:hypothetical protein